MARFGDLDTQYFDDAGDPLVNGKIYFYETGTTTPKDTYSDVNLTIPNTNPVILTAAGRQPNIFFQGVAKAILATSAGVQILVRDPVGETASTFGNPWIASKNYNANDVVQGSDGNFYVSLVSANINQNPVSTTGYWTYLYSVEWNSGTTYKLGSVVTYETIVYQSLQNSNLNHNPSSATSYWVPIQLVWSSTTTYAINANVVGTDGILYTSLQNSNTGNIPASSPSWWVGTSAAAAASASAALASETAAAASESAAATSESNAAASASTASTQATNAANSASAASTSATNASNSESAASTSASNASTSETNAANSATAASTSASNAAASASAASTSETNAAASETAAAASEAAAAASESAAATSETNAANSASAASASEANASTSAGVASLNAASAASSASSASASAAAAQTAETGVEAAVEEFEGLYLGAKSTPPTTDNQGNPLQTGTLYFNTVSNTMFVWTGSSWVEAGSAVNGTYERKDYVATSGQTTFSAVYDLGFVDVYLNGSKLVPTTDFSATDGTSIVLVTGAVTGDNISIVSYGAFLVADTYTQAQANARFAQVANNLSDLDSAATARTNLGLGTIATAATSDYAATANNLSDLSDSDAALVNLGLTATATELNYTDGVTSNIQTQLDATASTGKAIAMAIVFGG